MKMDYVDLIYAERPPDGLLMDELVSQVGGLIRTGKARAWGVLNWRPALLSGAAEAARRQGLPPPCAAQLAYSLVQRSMVEDGEMESALKSCGAGVVASYVMAGGALTGKYTRPDQSGRLSAQAGDPKLEPALRAAGQLEALGARIGTTPAALAIAFALRHPRVTSVLFGATSPAQLEDDAAAVDLAASLDQAQLAELSQIGR
jgi:aryl-alcohol dehydrogenase-like predicted oxidoreductase